MFTNCSVFTILNTQVAFLKLNYIRHFFIINFDIFNSIFSVYKIEFIFTSQFAFLITIPIVKPHAGF